MGFSIEQILNREIGDKGRGPFRFIRYEGFEKDGESGTLLAFQSEGERPEFIFKVTSDKDHSPRLETEYRNLGLLAGSPGRLKEMVPAPLWLKRFDQVLVLGEAAVRGRPLKSYPPAPFYRGRLREGFWKSVAGVLVELARAAGGQPTELGEKEMKEHFTGPAAFFREKFRLSGDEERYLDAHLRDLDRIGSFSLPLCYNHGDFCPSNLLREGSELYVIDWEEPLRPGLPLADLFRFLKSCALNYMPEKGRGYGERLASFFSSKASFVREIECRP